MAVNNILSVPFSLVNYQIQPPKLKTQFKTNRTHHSLSSPTCLPLRHGSRNPLVFACSTGTSSDSVPLPSRRSSKKLYVSGLSFRTTEESLRNAFNDFGQLVEVNLVMDKIANRPRGFAFLRYATEEESQRAIEGMHGKLPNQDQSYSKAINKTRDNSERYQAEIAAIMVGKAPSPNLSTETHQIANG